MPRSNRCIQSGHIYHITHRCHNRKFLLRFRFDRIQYCARLRRAIHKHRITLLGFCVTCNHVHLLVTSKHLRDLSRFMQQLEGEFARYYNRRKRRSGAFWGERFHCTMIEGGDHLWNCLRYIDLNMVRSGVVRHPSEWAWCGYHELVGKRKRFRLLDIDRLVDSLGLSNRQSLAATHKQRISEAIESRHLVREEVWTESIAVGNEAFVREIASRNKRRKKLTITAYENDIWCVREDSHIYAKSPASKTGTKK